MMLTCPKTAWGKRLRKASCNSLLSGAAPESTMRMDPRWYLSTTGLLAMANTRGGTTAAMVTRCFWMPSSMALISNLGMMKTAAPARRAQSRTLLREKMWKRGSTQRSTSSGLRWKLGLSPSTCCATPEIRLLCVSTTPFDKPVCLYYYYYFKLYGVTPLFLQLTPCPGTITKLTQHQRSC
jgi:hypothetical protein